MSDHWPEDAAGAMTFRLEVDGTLRVVPSPVAGAVDALAAEDFRIPPNDGSPAWAVLYGPGLDGVPVRFHLDPPDGPR